jgi:hypothetical protein
MDLDHQIEMEDAEKGIQIERRRSALASPPARAPALVNRNTSRQAQEPMDGRRSP